jgi:anhydro-N-acetylmuramic acid kinase
MTNAIRGQPQSFHILGIMSGSSLDGLDMASCLFREDATGWTYDIGHAETSPYPEGLREQLVSAPQLKAEELHHADVLLGRFIGHEINRLIREHRIEKVRYIASHGHTALHNPSAGYSLQIGHAPTIASLTGLPVIYDFRSLDIALGGQGAPLVPIGDELLFPDYDYCLNLGGFSNISYKKQGKRMAFDICPVNKAINHLARRAGKEMDHDGAMAREGKTSERMLKALNALDFYHQKPPKSLGDNWFNSEFIPILDAAEHMPLQDILRTVCEHIAAQIAASTQATKEATILVTGGGAHNAFLMEMIRKHNTNHLVIPGDRLVEYKEAMVFALMGALRSLNEHNCLASATGASRNCSGGVIVNI